MKTRPVLIMLFVVLCATTLALFFGRYGVSPDTFSTALYAKIKGLPLATEQEHALMVVLNVRLPRVLAALIIGASLSVSGATYQAVFLNPLVSPGILGVLAGASCGAGIGIIYFSSWIATQFLAFSFACLAVGLSLLMASFIRQSSLLVLVLGGMISTSFFTAITSLLKFIADPDKQLPELVYWIMGTLSRIQGSTLLILGLPILFGIMFICMHGKVVNALSMGEEEALTLGIPVKSMRLRLIASATFICALSVSLVGIIGWVGLVVPHIMRFIAGPDNRTLLPLSALGGALFLLITDLLTRNIFTAELPIGIFTSLISLPIFIFSLRYSKRTWK